MASATKVVDPAFQGVGQRIGSEIWRIENFQPVPLPKSDYGKFYMGDSYIILQTTSGKGGAYLYDIHFWIGRDTSQDEAGTAAIKTVELDAVLGGRAVQHRELQGHESDKFLSYFKPCIIPLEGGVASGFKKCEDENFETRLYVCRGKRVVKLKQVPFARSSLNHDDVFILDTENKIYQFNGANSNIQERAKALEVIQYFKEKYHEGKSEVAIIDDGKLVAESDSGEFWVLFGGFAPIGKKATSEDDVTLETTPGKLYSITDGQVKMLAESELSKSMLENNNCYLLDCGAEVFVWVGRVTQVEDRKSASQAAEEFISNQNRPKSTRVTRVIQGFETHSFKSNFESWSTATGTTGVDDGKGKVAAMLKQQGVDVKGIMKGGSANEEVPHLLEGGGKIEVWRINGSAKTPVPQEEIGKFYSGDCYIILYTYHSGDKKEDYYLSCWIGKDSIQEDQMMATRLANTMTTSLKGRPVQGRVIQGKEPPQFIALFQPMVVFKGGVSSGYKKFIADKGLSDETYTADSVALIRISGASVHNNKAVQVDAVATSLSSTDCFLLQSGSSIFIWNGNFSTSDQQQLAVKIAEFLKPGVAYKHAKEGTESSAFWFALGGKQSYTSKKVATETVRDPHLYAFLFNKGKFEVSEIFNFSQDDLLTEDMLILDTHAEVFVWVGQSVDSKEKQKAFEIGQKYIELAAALEGLSLDVPLYKITEGNEPSFFTTYFLSWDATKATTQGNSFEKKLLLLFGTAEHALENDRSNGSSQSGPTQRASALAALSSAFNPLAVTKTNDRFNGTDHSGPTQRASALAALSSAFNPSPKTTTTDKLNSSSNSGPTQRASALAALSSAFNPSAGTKTTTVRRSGPSQGSQRAAAVAALSTVLTAEQRKGPSDASSLSSESPSEVNLSDERKFDDATLEVDNPQEDSGVEESVEGGGSLSENNEEGSLGKEDSLTDENGGESTFSYERLKAKSTNPARGINYKQREAYLSESEFQSVFGITKEAFYQQPKWKQDLQKKKLDLF
ncbi:villin-2 [Cinnamomum micranthum f. kanehirae]|uniref:Villin-2 n=1 Tax=Cinnamomum micranthum f. kanehirae TaxID=337451 RepID=A0A443PX76_9MAGN|nr:villin-2 [Cinnamomum micranthum f. kanehirae]